MTDQATTLEPTTTVIDLTTPQAVVGFRYPGSPPFGDNDLERQLFKGRDRESSTVLHSILGCDLFLLYAVSGLGKTSLLNAGVMHELRARGYWPVSVRLNEPMSNPTRAILNQIEIAAAADPTIELEVRPGAELDSAELTLWDMLGSLEAWRNDELQQLVLVLDQFEELFTLGWDEEVRSRFVSEFGDVVRGHQTGSRRASADRSKGSSLPPRVKFVLVIREDALGELEALATDIPNYMRHRFRLGPLDLDQAEAAIREPGLVDDGRIGSQRFGYTEAAAQEILDFLRTTTDRGSTIRGDSVDPSQLQIICQYIERAILPNKKPAGGNSIVTIDAPDLGGREGHERILTAFYDRTVESFPKSQQKAIESLCESGLINQNGRRLSLEEGEIASAHSVTPQMLQQLVDHRLLRADPRVGSVYYEISHDTLVAPILAHRDRRRAEQRRKRLRWAALAAGVIAVTVGALAAFVLYGNDAQVEAKAVPLGEAVAASIDDEGSIVRFVIADAPEAPLVIEAAPDVTSGENLLDVEIGGENRAPAGQPEWSFLPPSYGGDSARNVNVTGNASTGDFTVTATLAEPPSLEADVRVRGTIDSVGEFEVFAVNGEVGSELILDANPVSAEDRATQDQAAEDKAAGKSLNMEIKVVAPDGSSRAVDVLPDGSASFTVGGEAGTFYVVVRGVGDSTGPFDNNVSALAVNVEALAMADEPSGLPGVGEGDGVITDEQPVEVFALDVEAGTSVAVEVIPDGDFDPVLEVIPPDGLAETVDYEGGGDSELAALTAEGRYDVRVTGYEGSTGSFQIGTSVFEAEQITEGVVDGSIGGTFDAAGFGFEGSGQLVAIDVDPLGSLDPILLIVDPTGNTRTRDLAIDGPESVVIATEPGPYLLVVSGFADTTGEFQLTTTTPTPSQLPVGGEAGGTLSSPGDVVLYEVAADGSDLDVTLVPSGGVDLLLEVAGQEWFYAYADDPGGVVEATVEPTEQGNVVLVVSGFFGSTGDFTVHVEPVAGTG
jgi:hypothetical protein